jgi:heptosyltransferase-2
MSYSPRNILIVQPSWVGDAVMATPTLRAIRELYPKARITYLMKRNLKPLYAGMPWADRLLTYKSPRGLRAGASTVSLGIKLRKGDFDLAILLPNSFKAALLCRLAGIPRIVGYDRDARHFLLTDRLHAPRSKGKWTPSPIIYYYQRLARYLGSTSENLEMQLFVSESDLMEARAVLRRCGLSETLDRPYHHAGNGSGGGPLVILNVGAQYGAAKLWLPERFAAVGDRLIEQMDATILVSGTPKEAPIIQAVLAAMRGKSAPKKVIDLSTAGLTLGALKEIVRRCDLMITNDTGPRHIAAAMEVPVVTIFGPTDPKWTEIYFELERQVSIPVFCGPCQLKTCPLDHRCMTGISADKVFQDAVELLSLSRASSPTGN